MTNTTLHLTNLACRLLSIVIQPKTRPGRTLVIHRSTEAQKQPSVICETVKMHTEVTCNL